MNVYEQGNEEEITQRQSLEAQLKNMKDLLEEKSSDLKQKADDLAGIRKRWKEAAMELDKLKSSQNRLPYQMTDGELKNEVTQLRYNIDNFAYRCFGDELPNRLLEKNPKLLEPFSKLASNELVLFDYLSSSEKRPFIIQAYMWKFLYASLFDRFLWAGWGMSAIRYLNNWMDPSMFPFPFIDFKIVVLTNSPKKGKTRTFLLKHIENFSCGAPKQRKWSWS